MEAIPMALMAGGKIIQGIAGMQAGKAANRQAKAEARDTINTGNA